MKVITWTNDDWSSDLINKIQWNLTQNATTFSDENTMENVVDRRRQMTAISSRITETPWRSFDVAVMTLHVQHDDVISWFPSQRISYADHLRFFGG